MERLAPDDIYLLSDLKAAEGCELVAYPDPLTKADPWTIGYGHTGPGVAQNVCWTQERCEETLRADVAACMADLDRTEPWWRAMSLPRQRVLVELRFNLGMNRLLGFHKALADMQMACFSAAASELRNSLAYRQLPSRYERLAKTMEIG